MADNKDAVWGRQDRDLLVKLSTQMEGVRSDISNLVISTSTRLTNLETNTASKIVSEDHETRIRTLEKAGWIKAGAAGAVGGIITLLVNLFSGTIHLH